MNSSVKSIPLRLVGTVASHESDHRVYIDVANR
jgi:hypothetical protein